MNSAVSFAQGAVAHATPLPPVVLERRLAHRRRMLRFEAVGGSLLTLVLLIYSYAGAVPILIVSAYFLSSIGLIGIFTVLSETHFSERFEDPDLTFVQVMSHIAVEVAFLLEAPQIGFAFLNAVFVIFAFGSLRMTSRQATFAWAVATVSLAPILMFTSMPIGLPVTTNIERVAAMLSYVLAIGLCAFVGLFGYSLRKTLYDRTFELKAAYRRIEELAELDELTGCLNRRCIMHSLEEEIARCHRLNVPCSIALIDLDFFKRVNDLYGHPAGDEVLRAFAITVFANIRSIDSFGRYGGEEFLLILPDTAAEKAARLLDRLRSIIAELDWSAFSTGKRVTMSAGVAALRESEGSDSLLARADTALYASKARGRNRISSAER